jgi:hypothetical protein
LIDVAALVAISSFLSLLPISISGVGLRESFSWNRKLSPAAAPASDVELELGPVARIDLLARRGGHEAR